MKILTLLSLLLSVNTAHGFSLSPPIRSFAHQRSKQCTAALNKYFVQSNTGKILKYDSKTRLLTIVTTSQTGEQDVSFYTSLGKVSSSQNSMSCASSASNDLKTLDDEINNAIQSLESDTSRKSQRNLRKIRYNCNNITSQLSGSAQSTNSPQRTLDSNHNFIGSGSVR
ncbi:MAG: hypothetical protein ACRBBP_01205 [Bdellovibrionales bacterium]